MRDVFDTSKYIGIPYTNKGRDWSGCDCWGLVRLIYKTEYGINLLSFSDDYENSEEGVKVKDVVQKGKDLFNNIEKESPEYGDIVVFRMKGNPCHVGVYVGSDRVLHVLRGTEAVIERLNSFRLKGRVEGFYEIKEEAGDTCISEPIKI